MIVISNFVIFTTGTIKSQIIYKLKTSKCCKCLNALAMVYMKKYLVKKNGIVDNSISKP